MDRIRIRGGHPLSGDIHIGGAKNAALPLMAAALLTEQRLLLSNVPRLADIQTMAALLSQHGIAVEPVGNDGRTLSLGGSISNTEAPYDIVRKMRASFLVLGPLLALLYKVAPNHVTTTEQVGRAMLKVVRQGYPKPVLEVADINSL